MFTAPPHRLIEFQWGQVCRQRRSGWVEAGLGWEEAQHLGCMWSWLAWRWLGVREVFDVVTTRRREFANYPTALLLRCGFWGHRVSLDSSSSSFFFFRCFWSKFTNQNSNLCCWRDMDFCLSVLLFFFQGFFVQCLDRVHIHTHADKSFFFIILANGFVLFFFQQQVFIILVLWCLSAKPDVTFSSILNTPSLHGMRTIKILLSKW